MPDEPSVSYGLQFSKISCKETPVLAEQSKLLFLVLDYHLYGHIGDVLYC